MEPFSIHCTTCNAGLKVQSEAALGKILSCPKCHSMVQVPQTLPDAPHEELTQVAAAAAIPPAAPDAAAEPVTPEVAAAVAPNPGGTGFWRGASLAGGGFAAGVILLVAIWATFLRSPPERPRVNRPVAAKPATDVGRGPAEATEEPADPPAVAAPPDKNEPIRLDPRWLPDATTSVASLRWNRLYQHSAFDAVVERAAPSLAPAVEKLATGLKFETSKIARLTWVGIDPSRPAEEGILIVEVSHPLNVAAAGGTLVDELVHGCPVYRLAEDRWPHPIVEAGESLVVTGPESLLKQIAASPLPTLPASALGSTATDTSKGFGFARLLRSINIDHDLTLLVDRKSRPADAAADADDRLSQWAAVDPNRGPLLDGPHSIALAADASEKLTFEVALACPDARSAERVAAALAGLTVESFTNGDRAGDGAVWLWEQVGPALAARRSGRSGTTVWTRLTFESDPSLLATTVLSLLPAGDAAPTGVVSVATADIEPEEPAFTGEPQSFPVAAVELEDEFAEIQERLAYPLPALEFNERTLADAMALLEDLSTVPIALDLAGLADGGVSADDKLSLREANSTVGSVLDSILAPRRLGYSIGPNGLLISSLAKRDETPIVVVHRVADLAIDDAACAELSRLIEALVEPISWQRRGGPASLIASLGELRVTHHSLAQAELATFLDRLRLSRGMPPLGSGDSRDVTLLVRQARGNEMAELPLTASFTRETPLELIVDQIRKSLGVNISLDLRALDAAGISPDHKATLTANKRPLEECLAELLEPLGLIWRVIDERSLEITTLDEAESRLDIEFHLLADLETPEAPLAALRQRIRDAVGGDVWLVEGGRANMAYDETSGYLIVLAPQAVQARIEDLLAVWRAPAPADEPSRDAAP